MGPARSTFYDAATGAADDSALVEAMAAVCDMRLVLKQKKVRRMMREDDLQLGVSAARSLPPTAITAARW